jgi:hypothetical protein
MIETVQTSRRQTVSMLLATFTLLPLTLETGRADFPAASNCWFQVLNSCPNLRSSATMVGLEYLRRNPQEGDLQQLMGDLFDDDLVLMLRNNASVERDLNKSLEKKIREDFENGRVVSVQGWILSISEARFCAVVALG